MNLIKPSFSTGYAKNASESANPNLWKGLVGAWMPSFGVTGSQVNELTTRSPNLTLENIPYANWEVKDKSLAVMLEGADDYLNGSYCDAVNFGYKNFTVISHFYVTQYRSTEALFDARSTNPYYGFHTYMKFSQKVRTQLRSSGSLQQFEFPFTAAGGQLATHKIYSMSTVVSREKSICTGYLNGIFIGSATISSSMTDINSNTDFKFGVNINNDFPIYGGVASLLIHHRALNQKEVKTLHANPAAPFQKKTTTVVSVPVAPVTTTAKAVVLKKPKPSYATGYARNASESANPNLWKGLVGAWMPSFGVTGGTLKDVSGNGNDGTLTNMDAASDWLSSIKGRTLFLDGNLDHINTGNPVVDLDSDFTFSAVVITPASLGNNSLYKGIIQKGDLSNSFGGKWASIHYNASGNAFALSIDDSSIKSEYFGSITIQPETPYLVTGVFRRGDSIELYVNARLDGSVADNSGICDSNKDLLIGSREINGSPSYFLYGGLVAVLIHNRALSPAEIKQLYLNPSAPFERKAQNLAVPAAPSFNPYWGNQATQLAGTLQ